MVDLRSHGIVKEHSRFESASLGPWAYEQQQLGFNYRITDIQAALGLSQLQRLDEIVAERNRQEQREKKAAQHLGKHNFYKNARCTTIAQEECSALPAGVFNVNEDSDDPECCRKYRKKAIAPIARPGGMRAAIE